MATQASQTTPMIPQGRSLTAEEATEVQENLARANFGMSLAEFSSGCGKPGSSTTTARGTARSSAWRCWSQSVGMIDAGQNLS